MMVIPKMERSILPQAIALTAITLMFSSAHAATAEQEEIQQLRAEVQALRTLVEQQLSKNEGNKALSIPETAVQHPVASTASNSSNSPLQFKTANGAEAKLYGFVRGDVAYQIEGGKGMFNRINAVSLAGDADQSSTEDRLDSTATTTRLGVDFSTPVDGVKVGGKVEVDFRGSNDSLRVRHAYLTYKN